MPGSMQNVPKKGVRAMRLLQSPSKIHGLGDDHLSDVVAGQAQVVQEEEDIVAGYIATWYSSPHLEQVATYRRIKSFF